MQLTTSQKIKIDQFARSFVGQYGGANFSDLIQDVFNSIDSGSIGIKADAGDVDSLAKDGGQFSVDPDASTGLTFALAAGRINNGLANVSVAPVSLTLAASTTNYIEVDRNGTVSVNLVGFTATSMPLYRVVTGSSAPATVTNFKTLMTVLGLGGITGVLMSTAQKTRRIEIPLFDVIATSTFPLLAPPTVSTLVGLSIVNEAAVATSDTDYYTFTAVNKGPSGTGTTALLASGNGNTTKATGGSSLQAWIARSLALTGTSANLATAAGDAIAITLTMTGTPTNLSKAMLVADFTSDN